MLIGQWAGGPRVCPTLEPLPIAPVIRTSKQSGKRKQARDMAFRKINERMELKGFWTRAKGTVLQGIVKKHVPKEGGPFYIIECTEPCTAVVNMDKKPVKGVNVGDYVGCAASSVLKVLQDECMNRIVRLTALERVPHKTRKKDGKPVMMHTFDIEVDEAD